MTTRTPAIRQTVGEARGVTAELDRLVRLRIASLLDDRRWYRRNRWAEWTDLRREGEVELRALLRLHRTARRLAGARPDPITEAAAWQDRAASYHDWQVGRG